MYNFEQIGFIPRSIVRTLKRFIKQISLKTDLFVIYEFRISRYIAIASIQCFFFLIICPWIFQILMKFLLINVFFQYIPTDIFINFHQQERAFSQIQTFSQKVYFETLFKSFKIDKLDHESMVLPRHPLVYQTSLRDGKSVMSTLWTQTGHRESMEEVMSALVTGSRIQQEPIYHNQNIEKSISFDRRSYFKQTVFDFVAIAFVPRNERPSPPGYLAAKGCIDIHKFELNKSVFKSQQSILRSYVDQVSRRSKKDFRFQIPMTGILPSQSDAHLVPKQKSIYEIYQTYFLQCAYFYNQQSTSIIINWILDLTTLLFFLFLLIFATPQILILKTFFVESLLSLSETTKCFFLIFFLDLLVGFHSSKSWEIFLQFLIEHFGFQIHQNFIPFFISTFPVLLDTIFKYWIFRYLNKISPSTVATYQAMIE